MARYRTSRTVRWNLLRLGHRVVEAGVVDTEAVTTIAASVVITEMTEMVVDEVIPEVIVIQMIGRSEERKIGHQDSRTITTETIVGVMAVMEIARAVAVVEDVTIEDLAQMTEIANAERKTGMLKLPK